MVKIRCTIDAHHVKAGLEALGKEAPRASMRAINKTLQTVKTQAVRTIADDLGIAQKEIRGDKDFRRGHRSALSIYKANPTSLRGSLEGTGKRFALIDFNAKDTADKLRRRAVKRGVSAKAGQGVTYRMQGQARRLPHAFIARMASGHIGVFQRTGKTRTPIKEKFGPSMPHVFKKHIKAALRQFAADALQKNMRHEIGYLLTFGRR